MKRKIGGKHVQRLPPILILLCDSQGGIERIAAEVLTIDGQTALAVVRYAEPYGNGAAVLKRFGGDGHANELSVGTGF